MGLVSLNEIDRKNHVAEIGYWLAKSAEGHGVMTEAVSELVDIAFGDPVLHRLWILVDVDNQKSVGIPERLGFENEGILRNFRVRDCDGLPRSFYSYSLLRTDPQP